MNLATDIFTVRTGRATVMIGLPAALGEVRGEAVFGSDWEVSQHIDMALAACGETHGIRQFCSRCGLDSHSAIYVDDRALRDWMVNAVRQGTLGVLLLPDIVFTAGALQARAISTRTGLALRIDRVTQGQSGAQHRPVDLIEAMQAEARQGRDGPAGDTGAKERDTGPPAPAGARPAGGPGTDLSFSDIRGLALEDRILEVLRRTLVSLEASGGVRQQELKALVERDRLPETVAVLTAWAESREGDVGALTNLALSTFGQAGLHRNMLAGLKALSQALACTRDAQSTEDLQRATAHLAHTLDLLGPPALHRLIAHSTSLPTAVPVKAHAGRQGPTPALKPPERYWPRPQETGWVDRASSMPLPPKWPTPMAIQCLQELEDIGPKKRPGKNASAAAKKAYNRDMQRKRSISEKLGEEAAIYELSQRLGRNIARDDPQLTIFEGRNTVNVMYIDGDNVHVIEAKGGNSQLGTRINDSGMRVEQGTPEYLADIARVMSKSPDPDRRAAGRKLVSAIKKGKANYSGVRARYDKKRPISGRIYRPSKVFPPARKRKSA